jgi:hypothetical protein
MKEIERFFATVLCLVLMNTICQKKKPKLHNEKALVLINRVGYFFELFL